MQGAQRDIITGPGAWIGAEIQHAESWIYQLDAVAVEEIDAALAHARRIGAKIPFPAEAFPLPRFAAELDRILEEIESGRGLVLGLFCMRTAKSGGASKLVSALTVHNVLREERPDLLETLYGMFHLDWRGEEPEGEKPWFSIPMFSSCEGKVSARICSLAYYESAGRFGEQYRPSDMQREALDAVQEIANRPEPMLTMEFREGDVQLINNHIMLHAREAFEDFDEPGRQRHLLRMWIAVSDARRRPLSDTLAGRYRWVREGGIPVKAAAQA